MRWCESGGKGVFRDEKIQQGSIGVGVGGIYVVQEAWIVLKSVQDKVLLAGKYLNVVRECGGVDVSKEVKDVPKNLVLSNRIAFLPILVRVVLLEFLAFDPFLLLD
jgi:hypothetical protein